VTMSFFLKIQTKIAIGVIIKRSVVYMKG